MNLRCFRCGGTVLVEPDEDGENIGQCMACSALQPFELVNGDRMTEEKSSFTAITSDWKAGALAELKKHIEVVAKADTSRAEAEKLHRLLGEFGVSVPDLPWKHRAPNVKVKTKTRVTGPRPWSEDDEQLKEMVEQGMKAPAIAAELDRTVPAVYVRISDLRTRGLLSPANS